MITCITNQCPSRDAWECLFIMMNRTRKLGYDTETVLYITFFEPSVLEFDVRWYLSVGLSSDDDDQPTEKFGLGIAGHLYMDHLLDGVKRV